MSDSLFVTNCLESLSLRSPTGGDAVIHHEQLTPALSAWWPNCLCSFPAYFLPYRTETIGQILTPVGTKHKISRNPVAFQVNRSTWKKAKLTWKKTVQGSLQEDHTNAPPLGFHLPVERPVCNTLRWCSCQSGARASA